MEIFRKPRGHVLYTLLDVARGSLVACVRSWRVELLSVTFHVLTDETIAMLAQHTTRR